MKLIRSLEGTLARLFIFFCLITFLNRFHASHHLKVRTNLRNTSHVGRRVLWEVNVEFISIDNSSHPAPSTLVIIDRKTLVENVICVQIIGLKKGEDCRFLESTFLEYLLEVEASEYMLLQLTILEPLKITAPPNHSYNIYHFRGMNYSNIYSDHIKLHVIQPIQALIQLDTILCTRCLASTPRVSVVIGTLTRDQMDMVLLISDHIHVILLPSSLILCEDIMASAALRIQCCELQHQHQHRACLPLVADYVIISLDKSNEDNNMSNDDDDMYTMQSSITTSIESMKDIVRHRILLARRGIIILLTETDDANITSSQSQSQSQTSSSTPSSQSSSTSSISHWLSATLQAFFPVPLKLSHLNISSSVPLPSQLYYSNIPEDVIFIPSTVSTASSDIYNSKYNSQSTPSSLSSSTSSSSLLLSVQEQQSPRSSADFSFQYGINIATLQHVCMKNKTTIIFYRNYDSNPIIEDELRENLKSTSSGFYTSDVSHAGWVFIEENESFPIHSLTNTFTLPFPLPREHTDLHRNMSYYFFPDVSVTMSPSFTPSIFHSSQVLLVLIHVSLHISTFPWIKDIHRVVFPTVPRTDCPWSLGLATLVLHFVSRYAGTSSGTADPIAAAYLEEDIEIMFHGSGHADKDGSNGGDTTSTSSTTPISSLVCFEKLIVIGTTELSTPFLSADTSETDKFRSFTYEFLNISNTISTPPLPEPIRPPTTNTSPTTTTTSCTSSIILSHPSNSITCNGNTTTTTTTTTHSTKTNARTSPHIIPIPSPNHALRITVIYRPKNRIILNLEDLITRIEHTGLADVIWLHSHILQLEGLNFKEQVQLMSDTDILISPHGAGLQNLMFMRRHSAVIELMTSPWYEPGYQCNALAFGVHYYTLPMTNLSLVYDCMFPSECLSTPLLVHRRSLSCYGMRQCNAVINIDAFEIQLWLASQAVRILKRQLSIHRRQVHYSDSDDNNLYDSNEVYSSNTHRNNHREWYRKAYITPLTPLNYHPVIDND